MPELERATRAWRAELMARRDAKRHKAAGAAAAASSARGGGQALPTELRERVLHGGADAVLALRLLEVLAVASIAQAPQPRAAAAVSPVLDLGA